jgi:hypothetical protein
MQDEEEEEERWQQVAGAAELKTGKEEPFD